MISENHIYQTVIITAMRKETTGVKTITLSYADGSYIPYEAGQFITLVFKRHGREERRSYSISSCPLLKEPLAITVKRIDNGAYSRMLADRAAVGDHMETSGVAGLFRLPQNDDEYDQLFFFAAGIGITPVLSLIKTILYSGGGKKVVLIYSNRTLEEVVFYHELRQLALTFPASFKLELLYSSSFDLSRARLNKSLLPLLLKEYKVAPIPRTYYFICGPFAYMRMAILSLEEQGIKDDQIKRENFNADDRPVRLATPPDKDTHQVALKWGGTTYLFGVIYPESILEAAKRIGLLLPYSCQTGRCGSCVAQCVSGKVWLSYNEALTDRDLKSGKILTCVGHPVGGDVSVEV